MVPTRISTFSKSVQLILSIVFLDRKLHPKLDFANTNLNVTTLINLINWFKNPLFIPFFRKGFPPAEKQAILALSI
jgi:hypothetical protein